MLNFISYFIKVEGSYNGFGMVEGRYQINIVV